MEKPYDWLKQMTAVYGLGARRGALVIAHHPDGGHLFPGKGKSKRRERRERRSLGQSTTHGINAPAAKRVSSTM